MDARCQVTCGFKWAGWDTDSHAKLPPISSKVKEGVRLKRCARRIHLSPTTTTITTTLVICVTTIWNLVVTLTILHLFLYVIRYWI